MKCFHLLFIVGFFQISFAQDLWMYPNHGQWDARILYNLPLSSGRLYIEEQGLTYFLSDATFHQHEANVEHEDHEQTKYHAIRHQFINAQPAVFNALDSSAHYHNYFLGNDQSKWKSKVKGTSALRAAQYFEN